MSFTSELSQWGSNLIYRFWKFSAKCSSGTIEADAGEQAFNDQAVDKAQWQVEDVQQVGQVRWKEPLEAHNLKIK